MYIIKVCIEQFVYPVFRCNGEDVRLMLWDTAGQEEFDAITKAYYRGAQACVLAFSTTDRDSFEAIHSWKIKVFYYYYSYKSYLPVVRLIFIISN